MRRQLRPIVGLVETVRTPRCTRFLQLDNPPQVFQVRYDFTKTVNLNFRPARPIRIDTLDFVPA